MKTEKKILMCDDEPEIGHIVRRIAEGIGYRMHFTTSAEEFRPLYREVAPDVVILDLVIPGTDGIELLRFLAEESSSSQIVLMSGYNPQMLNSAQLLGEAHMLHMAGVVTKPVRVAELRTLLTELF